MYPLKAVLWFAASTTGARPLMGSSFSIPATAICRQD